MFKTLVILFQFVTIITFARTDVREFDSSKIKKIELMTESGLIDLERSTNQKKSFVAVTQVKLDQKCQIKSEMRNQSLVISVIYENKNSLSNCDANIGLQVPKSIDVQIQHGSGDINIKDMQGKLDFKVGSGNIKAQGQFNEVDGQLGSGSIVIDGLMGESELKLGSGNITLSYNTITPNGDLEIKTGKGDATVYFPKGTLVWTELKSGSGHVTNNLNENKKTGFKISMKSGMGDLIIQEKK